MKTIQSVGIVEGISKCNEIKEAARYSPKYFTRNRTMAFADVIYFLLNPAKECLQVKLNRFMKTIGKPEKRMSQQAISKARSHFDHTPFEKMARLHVEEEYGGGYELPKWNGYHIFGIDGSTAVLPNSPELKTEFGVSKNMSEVRQACAGISILCDVLHDWIIDASINHYPQDERASAKKHIEFLEEKMSHISKKILLFDRGYPSVDMLEYLEDRKMNYVMRCQKSWLAEVENAPLGDTVCVLRNGQKVRIYKFILSSGELETLITNLYEVPEDAFPKLYFLRWGVEGKYDVLKNKLELENFSGYTKNSILQDFWVTVTLSIIVEIAKKEAAEKIQERTDGKRNKHKQIPNVSQLVGSMKDEFVSACRMPSDSLKSEAIRRVINEISLAVTTVRPDRPSRKRKPGAKKKQYPINRKSNI